MVLYAHSIRMPPPAVAKARSAWGGLGRFVMSILLASRMIVTAASRFCSSRPETGLNARTPKLQVPG